ncbi:hypothetical protein J3E64_003254 [Sphingobium sp. OAS761]|uniref:DUF4169 family protein n=1 Tax=Sphingobium sp. OAS761 TaxID=2817901 RepID=UPI0020A0D01F|nr:DUF4169 family protein [Sphingobium sp. OAS761]MCP1471543.1 hypothetical protein [Sphingobium sp. OAS761]
MGDVINLRQARKARARAEKAEQAVSNRVRFGRTKAQRLAEAAEDKRTKDALERTFREDRQNKRDDNQVKNNPDQ